MLAKEFDADGCTMTCDLYIDLVQHFYFHFPVSLLSDSEQWLSFSLLLLGTKASGVISKIDQTARDQKNLAAIQVLLLNQGPPKASDIPGVALIGQSVSIASAQTGSVGSEISIETPCHAESESLRSILTGAPPSKLGGVALGDTLVKQMCERMKVRLPNLLSG